jgi:SSS family solute:Na+ symporter
MKQLQTADYLVFFVYFIVVISYGIWVFKKKQGTSSKTKDFFLQKAL